MQLDVTYGLSPAVFAAALAMALVAGFVKGTVGFAMPMILISGLGSVMSAEAALAGLIIPTLVTNLWQSLRNGLTAAVQSAQIHWRFIAILLVFLGASAQLVTLLPGHVMFLIVGVPVTLFATLQLIGWRPTVPPERKGATELGVGAIAGAIGGISGVWGPPTVLYLTALETPKTEQMRVQGVVYAIGAVMLTAAHLRSGVLTAHSVPFSALLLIPACTGMALGFAVGDRLDQNVFRKVTLVVLVLAGLNLVRRGLM